jgi:hypothetical protein
MALRLRRGTDAERLLITPAAGELIYTTDTNAVFVGDGSTPGGLAISVAGLELTDLADVSSSPAENGMLLVYSGGEWVPQLNPQITVTGNVLGADSTLLVDADNSVIPAENVSGTFTGNVVGNITGDVTGDVTGTVTGNLVGNVDGDVTGSVFSDDSTLIVDAVNSTVTASLYTDQINLPAISGNFLQVQQTSGDEVNLEVRGTQTGNNFPNFPGLYAVSINESENYLDHNDWINGTVKFGREDAIGRKIVTALTSRTGWTELKVAERDNPDNFPDTHQIRLMADSGYVGIGINEPEAALHNPRDSKLGDIYFNENNITTVESNANIRLAPNGTGTIELDVPTQITVGAAGGAAAIPATPDIYFKVNINGTEYVVPGFAVS